VTERSEERTNNSQPSMMTAKVEGLDVWRLCKQYTVVQAALLVAGHDPATAIQVEQLRPEQRPPGYEAAKNALVQQLHGDSWFGRIVELDEVHKYRNGSPYNEIDVEKSIVWRHSIKSWLSDQEVNSGFFFPNGTNEPSASVPGYLNPDHPRYAPKLAAAVRAWQAYGDISTKVDGKSPKQVLAEWLVQNAAQFGLADQEGKLNNEGIQDVAKVANWQTKGGAPRTPGKAG
jgi:hypothetical protein